MVVGRKQETPRSETNDITTHSIANCINIRIFMQLFLVSRSHEDDGSTWRHQCVTAEEPRSKGPALFLASSKHCSKQPTRYCTSPWEGQFLAVVTDLLCCLCDLLQESTQYQDMDKLCRLSHSTRTCRDTQAHGGWPYPIEPVLVEIIFRCSQRRIAVFYLTLLSSYCVLGPAQFLLSSLVCFL